MLENIIPNFLAEKKSLSKLATAGWVMGYGISYAGPEYLENAYPEEWRRIYEQRNYWFIDPAANWSFTNNGHIRWSEISYTLDRQPMMDHARLFGLKYGVCFAVNNDDYKSFLTISHKSREFTDQEIEETYRKFLTWTTIVKLSPVVLTADEKKVLTFFRDGMNRQEVAEAAQTSEATVKRRLAEATAKLNCKSTTQAVALATARRLL